MAIALPARIAGLAVLTALLLSGCADTSSSDEPTLAETKSPVQLLRNEAASRVQESQVEEILKTQDESTNCRTPETDPEGLLRSWRSTSRLKLVYSTSVEVSAVVDNLAESFVKQGWDRGIYGTASIIELTREGSETNIHISFQRADDEAQSGAEVQIAVAGPCVMTKGKTSDEVVNLGPVDDK
jgi:hypothetical protein